MSGGEVYVSFGGDTAGLEASIATAKASVADFTREIGQLAREMQSAGATAESDLGQKLLSVATQLSAAKGAVADLKGQLSAAAPAEGVAAGLTKVEFSAHEAAHAIHGMLDLAMGETALAERGFLSLATSLGAANPQFIEIGAAALAAAGGLAAVFYEAFEFKKALDGVSAAAAVDQLKLTDDQASKLIATIKQLAGVGDNAAAEIARAFLAIGEGGPQIAQIASGYLPLLAEAMGKTAPEAAAKLAEMFAELSTKGRAYVADTAGVSAATLKAYDSYVSAGETGKAYATIVDSIIARLEPAREKIAGASAALDAQQVASAAAAAGITDLNTVEGAMAGVLDAASAKIAGQTATLRVLRDQLADTTNAARIFEQAIGIALKLDKVGADINKTTGDIALMKEALAGATAKGDSTGAGELAAGIERATDSLKKLQQQAADGLLGRDATGQADAAIAHLDATWRGSTVARLTAEREVWQQIANGENSSAEQVQHARAEVESKTKEITAASYSDYKAAEDVKVAAAGKGSAAVIAIREQEVAQARAIFGAGSDQERAAIEEVARAKEAAATRGASAAKAGAKDELAATMEAAKQQVANIEKATSDTIARYAKEAQSKQITEAQKVQYTLAAIQKGLDAEEDALGDELALDNLSAKQKQQLNDMGAKAELASAHQVVEIQEDAAGKAQQAWQQFTSMVDGAFTSQISGLLNHTETFGTAARKVAMELAEHFISAAADIALNWAMTMVGMKSAVAAFNAAIAPLMTSASVGTAAASKPGILAQVTADTGEAYAGFAAFFAPTLGPGALGAAAGLASQVGATATTMVGLDIGAWEIPHGLAAVLHPGEMVVPESFASGFRSAAAGGGDAPASTHVGLTVNMSAIDSQSGYTFLQNNIPALARMLQGHINRNPSTYPGGL